MYDSNCRRCLLSESPRSAGLHVCIPGEGPAPSDIALYGEAPGANEEEQNRPFVGDAGHELDSLLLKAGTKRSNVYISNPVRCRPPSNRRPTKGEVEACLFYTIQELEAVQPKVLVALGGAAIEALTGYREVGKNRGKLLPLLPIFRSDVKVIPTYHPAAFLHNQANRQRYSEAIIEDFKLAQKVVSTAESDYTVATEPSEVRRTLAALAACEELACDLEWVVIPATKGTESEPAGRWPWSRRQGVLPQAVSIAFAGRVGHSILSCAVPFPAPDYVPLGRILANRGTIYHNAMGDLIWLYSLGYDVKLAGCTLILASLLNLDTSLGLKPLAALLTDMPPWQEEASGLVGTLPTNPEDWKRLLTYNGRDCIADLLLNERLMEMVEEKRRRKVMALYRQVLLPAVKILARASLVGVPMDVEGLGRAHERAREKMTALTENIGRGLDLPGNYEQIIGSDAKLGPYIEAAAGIRLPRTAIQNRASVKNDHLSTIKDKHPAIRDIVQRRHIDGFIGKYSQPWLKMMEMQGDERLHTVYRLFVAATGRSSAESEMGNTFQQFLHIMGMRRLVKARGGWGIMEADQSQIEMRIAAWLANEPTMIRLFNEGKDIHRATAGWLKALGQRVTLKEYRANQQEWIDGVTDEERYRAKPPGFGLLFGGSWRVLQDIARNDYNIVLTDSEAELGHRGFFMLYDRLEAWHDSCWKYVRQGWCPTEFGRVRDLGRLEREDDQGKLRKAVNTPVQATASDLSLFCTDYSWELLVKEYGEHVHDVVQVVGFFHDAELLHFLMSERSTIEAIVTEAFEHPPLDRLGIELPVPLKADIEVGETWK